MFNSVGLFREGHFELGILRFESIHLPRAGSSRLFRHLFFDFPQRRQHFFFSLSNCSLGSIKSGTLFECGNSLFQGISLFKRKQVEFRCNVAGPKLLPMQLRIHFGTTLLRNIASKTQPHDATYSHLEWNYDGEKYSSGCES